MKFWVTLVAAETKLTKKLVRPHLVDSGGCCGSTVERDYHS